MPLLAGVSPDLLLAAAWIFVFGFLAAARQLPWRVSFLIAAVKVAIPLLYFANNPSGAFHLLDDLGYFYDALGQIQKGSQSLWVFLTFELPIQVQASSVPHVLYNLWNILGMVLFGPHYFAPVFLNVGLTFAAGYLFFGILREAGFSRDYCRFALAFFLLHPDILAWSSFLNLKDVLVLTLTLAALRFLLKTFRRPSLGAALGAALALGALFFLRFYAPLLVVMAVVLYFALNGRYLWTAAALAVAGVALSLKVSVVERSLTLFDPARFFPGLLRFVLTPQPWALSSGYEFLFVPSVLYLLFLPAALLALPSLWAHGRAARFLLLYLAVVLATYAFIPDLQGIRQRFQVSFLFIWMQFHALRAFARYALPSPGFTAMDRDATRQPEPRQDAA